MWWFKTIHEALFEILIALLIILQFDWLSKHSWPCSPKMIVSTGRRPWCLSASKNPTIPRQLWRIQQFDWLRSFCRAVCSETAIPTVFQIVKIFKNCKKHHFGAFFFLAFTPNLSQWELSVTIESHQFFTLVKSYIRAKNQNI